MFYSVNNAKSADLAETIRRAVIEQVQPDNTRACKRAESRVYILSHVDVPAVFAECGFLSNPEEAEKLCADLGGSSITTSALVPASTSLGSSSSALPKIYSAFTIPFIIAFRFASRTALFTDSIPITFLAFDAQ